MQLRFIQMELNFAIIINFVKSEKEVAEKITLQGVENILSYSYYRYMLSSCILIKKNRSR